MNHIKNHRVIALTLLLSLSIQSCISSAYMGPKQSEKKAEGKEQKVKQKKTSDSDDELDELTSAFESLSIEGKAINALFETVKDQDETKMLSLFDSDTTIKNNPSTIFYGLFSKLLTERISTQRKDFLFITKHFDIPNKMLDKAFTPFFALRPKNQEDKTKNKQYERIIKEIKKYKNSAQIKRAVNIQPNAVITNNSTTYDSDNYRSEDRESDQYSDSENEGAPHFNGVYNLTKSGKLSIEHGVNLEKAEAEQEIVDNYVRINFDDITPEGLQKDAIEIQGGLGNSVTVLCVALMQNDGRIKQFVFSNLPSVYQISPGIPNCVSTASLLQTITTRAHNKYYHVIMAQQAHAEAELVQFLQERPGRYTHIISMGCSRDHCKLCGKTLTRIFSPELIKKTSASQIDSEMEYDNWLVPKALEHILQQHELYPFSNMNLSYAERKKIRLKSDYAYGMDFEHKHRRLNQADWGNRLWINSELSDSSDTAS